jgi:3-deoxy-D-manno-octulosonic-acid transferase
MILYNLVVKGYGLTIRAASLRKAKAAQWIEGRKNWRSRLISDIGANGNHPVIWVHCASYGEFEQGRPILEGLKIKYPEHKILLSFFSPSGYESFKDWPGADVICYLPLDSRENARDFITIVNPVMAVFIKYEFWLYYLRTLKKNNIPTYLVSAVFKTHHPFFKWYGDIFRRSLGTFSKLFIQDEMSGELLKSIGISNFEICGDTRFDRVLQIRQTFKDIPEIAEFKGNSRLLIAGSTWPKDEELVLDAFKKLDDPSLKLLLVPHDVEDRFITSAVKKIKERGLSYSVFTEGIDPSSRILILNTMGMLSRSYHYADAAYIGGGFDSGLHNSLEAAVYGIPVLFYGEDYVKFNEAVELLRLGAGVKVVDSTSMAAALKQLLNDDEKRKQIKMDLNTYFQKNANSTKRILDSISL